MILLIDNYDSFTFNLVHYLGGLGAQVDVHRNDKISVDDVLAREPEALVLSPGPCTPNEAGICLDLIKRASAHIPTFGVCLGHQAIGQAFGGSVIRAPVPCTASSPKSGRPAQVSSAASTGRSGRRVIIRSSSITKTFRKTLK